MRQLHGGRDLWSWKVEMEPSWADKYAVADQREIQAFLQLRAVENVLRELIIEQLTESFGPRWQRTQVPDDIRRKLYDAIAIERRYKWVDLIPYHPIYYTDFPDLKKIIERNDNWTNAFRAVLGDRKDIISGMLSELEPLRNAIAHGRSLGLSSARIVANARGRFHTALGEERFSSLLTRSTVAPNVFELLTLLRTEGEIAAEQMAACGTLSILERWNEMKSQWWFDDDYLGADLAAVRAFFELAGEYRALTRARGDGYRVDRWLTARKFEEALTSYRESWSFLGDPR
jgi:hypothetical protein